MAVKDFSKRKPRISFSDILLKMERYFTLLNNCSATNANTSDFPSKPGVYVFYEKRRALYVGRTGNIRKRIQQHRNIGSSHNDAPFAYHIAKLNAKTAGIDVKNTRGNLCNNAGFKLYFLAAKVRVSKMKVRYIEIEDEREQSLFEYYASIELHTRWNNHSNS